MGGRIEITGVEEMMAEIRQRLGNGAKRIENRGLREAGQIIADEQRKLVNRSRRDPHIQDDIRVSGVRRDTMAGTRYVKVGGTRLTKWRHHFLEFGTSKMAPRPWHQPGFEASKDAALQAIIENFRRGLEQK